MKICYLTYSLDPRSGWGRYSLDLIGGVKRNGVEVIVLKELEDEYEGKRVLKGGLVRTVISSLKAINYVKDCDIIHALDVYPYGVIAYLARMFSAKKFVITAQGTYAIEPLYKIQTALLSRMAVQSADKVIAISNFTKEELLKKVRLKNIDVINHGVDFKLFYSEHLQDKNDFILSVGALKCRKGYHVSIPAFALAKKNFPSLRYKIVGSQIDVNYLTRLKSIAAKCEVLQDIEFLEKVSDEELRNLYQKAKLFMLTSVNFGYSFEGFGLVFLEAACAGLPVIGTLGNGIEDAIKNGYNGILVPQGDVGKTAEAIVAIAGDRQNWHRMSKNSYQWAQEHDLGLTVKKYIAIYERILS